VLVALQFLPEDWHRALWYDRQAVADGEWWRIVTGNLVHLGYRHLALNVGALLIGIWIFYPGRTPYGWVVAQLACSVSTSLGLYFFEPDLQWCIGMSGALHGLLMIGALDWWRQGERLGLVMALGWGAKLVWEQTFGAVPLSEATLGAPVVTAAHLWGAVGGLLFVAGERWWQRQKTTAAL
jgi:rhomboid family GlyGly-CTERM serine protease